MKLVKMMDDVLPQNVINTLCRLVCAGEKKYPYVKLDNGQYRTYCPDCQRYNTVSKEEFKRIRSEKVCPLCDSDFSCTTKTTHKIYYDYISLLWNNMTVGYYVAAEWNFGQPIKLIHLDQYMKALPKSKVLPNGKTMVKCGYYLGAMGSKVCFNSENYNGFWRQTVSENYYWRSLDYYSNWTYKFGTRYDIKKLLDDCYDITKSNQVKMILQHRFNSSLLTGIKMFDLNTAEEVEKYKEYLINNHFHYREMRNSQIKGNVYLLDYLARNKIDLGRYVTYSERLKTLGFKLDRPTDFEHRYEVVSDLVQEIEDAPMKEQIKERYDSLPKYAKDNISILPFEKAKDIRKCGKKLHNCIGGYVRRYAEGDTDIYHLDLDGAIKVAIEISDKTLRQAHTDHNGVCPANLMKHIKSFCKTNGFSLGHYA